VGNRPEKIANRYLLLEIYGFALVQCMTPAVGTVRKITTREMVMDRKIAVPAGGGRLVNLLQKASPQNKPEG